MELPCDREAGGSRWNCRRPCDRESGAAFFFVTSDQPNQPIGETTRREKYRVQSVPVIVRPAADFPDAYPASTAYIPREFPSAKGIAPPCPTGNIPQRTAATQRTGGERGPTPMGPPRSHPPASGSALPKISRTESAASLFFPPRIRRSKRAL